MKKSGITSTLNFSYPCMVVSSTEWRERPVRCILSHSSSRRLLIRLYLHLSPFQPSYRSLTVSPFIPLFLFMSVRQSVHPFLFPGFSVDAFTDAWSTHHLLLISISPSVCLSGCLSLHLFLSVSAYVPLNHLQHLLRFLFPFVPPPYNNLSTFLSPFFCSFLTPRPLSFYPSPSFCPSLSFSLPREHDLHGYGLD